MDVIVVIGKSMLYIELLVIFLFLLFAYCFKLHRSFFIYEDAKIFQKDARIIIGCCDEQRKPTRKELRTLAKNPLATLEICKQLDHDVYPPAHWMIVRGELIHAFFLPQMRSLAQSRKRYKRYYASKFFEYYYDQADEALVQSLIQDPFLLTSVSASRIGFKHASEKLINTTIDIFSTLRRIRQSVLSSIAHECGKPVENIVIKRLASEKDPYIKAFCYRLLQQFPATADAVNPLNHDINSEITDLCLSSMNYAAHNVFYRPLVTQHLTHEKWEARAMAAKLVGAIKANHAVDLLAKALKDPEWWVRIRAAESLKQLGHIGIQVLQSQSKEEDEAAFEAAQKVLTDEGYEGAL